MGPSRSWSSAWDLLHAAGPAGGGTTAIGPDPTFGRVPPHRTAGCLRDVPTGSDYAHAFLTHTLKGLKVRKLEGWEDWRP